MQEMALKSQTRCGTLDDIPGISDDIKRMYQILKRMESCQSTGSGISDFDISEEEELDSDDELPGKEFLFKPNSMSAFFNVIFNFRHRPHTAFERHQSRRRQCHLVKTNRK